MLKTELGHKNNVTLIFHIIIIIRNRVGEKYTIVTNPLKPRWESP